MQSIFSSGTIAAQYQAMMIWKARIGYSTLSVKNQRAALSEFTGVPLYPVQPLDNIMKRITVYARANGLPLPFFKSPGEVYIPQEPLVAAPASAVTYAIDLPMPKVVTVDYHALSPMEQVATFQAWKASVGYSSLTIRQKRSMVGAHMGMPINDALFLARKIYAYAVDNGLPWGLHFTAQTHTPGLLVAQRATHIKQSAVTLITARLRAIRDDAENIKKLLDQHTADIDALVSVLLGMQTDEQTTPDTAQPGPDPQPVPTIYQYGTYAAQWADLCRWADTQESQGAEISSVTIAEHMALSVDAARARYIALQEYATALTPNP